VIETTNDCAIVEGMIDVLWAGAGLDTFSDVQDLLDAIAVLNPGNEGARVVLAWWHVRARAWGEALGELRRVEREGELSSRGTALAAVCLYALGDPAWRTYAYAAAYQSEDAMATRTANALLAAPEIRRR
jgi:type III secretion protein HrpB1